MKQSLVDCKQQPSYCIQVFIYHKKTVTKSHLTWKQLKTNDRDVGFNQQLLGLMTFFGHYHSFHRSASTTKSDTIWRQLSPITYQTGPEFVINKNHFSQYCFFKHILMNYSRFSTRLSAWRRDAAVISVPPDPRALTKLQIPPATGNLLKKPRPVDMLTEHFVLIMPLCVDFLVLHSLGMP